MPTSCCITALTKLLDAYQEDLLELDELRQRVRLRKRERALKAEQQALQDGTLQQGAFLQLTEQLDQFLARLRQRTETLMTWSL